MTTESSAFIYTTVTPDATPPPVSTEPVQILVGEAIRLVASASDNVGISKVEFFRTKAPGDIPSGATPLTTANVAPYQGHYDVQSEGTEYVVVVATDTADNKTKSDPISFKIYQ